MIQTMTPPSGIKLEATAGTTGAVVMMLELTASRVLAPAIGSSLVAWTAIIGTIMATLAVGYELGGRLADRRKTDILQWILLGASISLTLSAFLAPGLLLAINSSIGDIRVRSILATLLLFGLPTVALGIVLPYTTRLALHSLTNAGVTVARMYASSTVGSIAGTFLAGFYLIAALGNAKTLLLLAVILCALALAWAPNRLSKIVIVSFLWAGVAAMFAAWKTPALTSWPGAIADIDTRYGRYLIRDQTDRQTGKPVRYLQTSPYGSQSSMFLDADTDLVAPYLKFFRLAFHFNPAIQRALVIGAGGYSFPKDFIRRNPEKRLDVVEIDGQLVDIARSYFHLNEYPAIATYATDARLFVHSTPHRYDAVFIDAFDPQYSIPFHLTTIEWARALRNILNPGGVIVVNMISAPQGVHSAFFRAQRATYAHIFPQVFAFPVLDPTRTDIIQNIVLIAQSSSIAPSWTTDNQELAGYLLHRYDGPVAPSRELLLTDDFAPVEHLTASFYALEK